MKRGIKIKAILRSVQFDHNFLMNFQKVGFPVFLIKINWVPVLPLHLESQ